MLSHYIPRPVEGLQFDQKLAISRKQNMPGESTYPVVQLQDGSIDYRYYAARGLLARNGEMKILLRKLMDKTRLSLQKLSTRVAVMTIGLACLHPSTPYR
jgi:hypothetical protein